MARAASSGNGELPAPETLGPEQIEYWQAQVDALRQRLTEVLSEGAPDMQLRVQVAAPGQLVVTLGAGTLTTRAVVTSEGARQMAAMIVAGADDADQAPQAPQGPPGIATPPSGLWVPGNGSGG